MSSKKKEVLSTAMRRTSEWIFSQEIPSDITVQIGDASFSLHKFPLVSKCGYIRKLVSESSDADLSAIVIPDIPGGTAAFELAAKFCYGINFEISTENIAMLYCVAQYLQMTEDYAVGNLSGRAEAYLNEVALQSLSGSVTVLRTAENLLPMAEKVKLVSRCIDAIAYLAYKDSQLFTSSSTGSSGTETGGHSFSLALPPQQKPIVDWWAEDLALLRIDMFHRVIIAMMARGFKQYAVGPILMLYAQKYLRGLEVFGKGRKKIEPKQEHEKRVILETIVSLLPKEKNALSVSFLSLLLRASIYLETTVACRLDLEKRMALQLGQAVLDDLLIPSYSFTGDTLFEVDTVRRIMMNYLEYEVEVADHQGCRADQELDHASTLSSDMERVGKLMENYLAEIASDRNLTAAKFIGLAEIVPERSRVTEDGMYRAIDIFLKAHPTLSEMDRKRVCSLMDCQKLSREACAHAAQNDRLPVHTVVQVLYHEQQRLREAMNTGSESPAISNLNNNKMMTMMNLNPAHPMPHIQDLAASNEVLSLQRENQDLKMEVFKLKMRLEEIDRSSGVKSSSASAANSPTPAAAGNRSGMLSSSATAAAAGGGGHHSKPPLPRKSFINSVSKKLGRLLVSPADGLLSPLHSKGRTKPSRDRRHSIS